MSLVQVPHGPCVSTDTTSKLLCSFFANIAEKTNACRWEELGPISLHFRRSPTCAPGLTNNLIDGGQPRAKPHLRKAKPNHVLALGWPPSIKSLVNPIVHVRPQTV